jgi:hypothetical protein
MSQRSRDLKRKQTEQEKTLPLKSKKVSSKHVDTDRRSSAALKNNLWQGGNAAVTNLIDQQRGGKPLDSGTRGEMERSFGVDFKGVRIHDDVEAQAKADQLDARAYTQGDDIYLGSAPFDSQSPAGHALLAHELAHVVQQRQAANVESDRVSTPNDAFENAADQAAGLALSGQPTNVQTGGTPPGVQRQPREGQSDLQEVVRDELEAFLRRALAAQGGKTVTITKEVRDAIVSLFESDPVRQKGIELLLSQAGLPGDPGDLAAAIARQLPDRISRAQIERLRSARVEARGPTSTFGKFRQRIERTAPGSAQREEEEAAARRAKGESEPRVRINATGATDPTQQTAQQRIDEQERIRRATQGEKQPTVIGPITFDPFRAIKILRGDKPKPAPQTQARAFDEVQDTINSISDTALIPAEARGTPQADDFDDAQQVARILAQLFDVAQQDGREVIDLRLADEYNRVKDPATIIAEVKRISFAVRKALPHHASHVRMVRIYFGKRLVSGN